MALRLTNIKLPVEENEADALRTQIAQRLGVAPSDVPPWRILRKSLDARSRNALSFVFSVAIDWPDEERWLATHPTTGVDRLVETPFVDPPAGAEALAKRPTIVGSGPGGLVAAYYLALRGYRPLVLERGDPVKQRVPAIRAFDRGGALDSENNYLFGEGGAGTFSDGKLTCRLSGPEVDWALSLFIECGGKPSIRYEQKPHLGSNRLPMIVRNLRRKIEALGGEVRFRCRVEDLDLDKDRIRGLATSSGYVSASTVLLAIGHSARDTYAMLHRRGVPMQGKAFQMGLRIEQPQDQVNRHAYGNDRRLEALGPADYAQVARGARNVFTFCMCAGGIAIPSVSEPGMFCTNGMSNSRHDTPFANSGVMVTLDPAEFGSDHPLAGVELQRRYEAIAFRMGRGEYLAPIQRAADFVADKRSSKGQVLESSFQRGVAPGDLRDALPVAVVRALQGGLQTMDRLWHGEFLRNATLIGPEMRGSSPLRMVRNIATRQSPRATGLYPVGEGAGYAGGIVSAAVDGLRSAQQLVSQYAPPRE